MKTKMQKECAICGGSFETTNKLRKYCDQCITNPEKAKREVQRGLRHIHELTYEPEVIDFTCHQCGKEFKSTKGLVHHCWIKENDEDHTYVFCSQSCKDEFKSSTLVCRECGKPLGHLHLDPIRYSTHFCNDDCKLKWKRKRQVSFKCAHCGKIVYVNKARETRTFCSKECYRKAVAEGWKSQNKKDLIERHETCCTCGKQYDRTYEDKRLVPYYTFCSDKCRTRWQEKGKEDMLRFRQQKKEEKLRKKQQQEQRIIETMSLCATCKVPYKECQYMATNYTVLPKGTHMDSKGKIIECRIRR